MSTPIPSKMHAPGSASISSGSVPRDAIVAAPGAAPGAAGLVGAPAAAASPASGAASVMDRLRAETREAHVRTEAVPFSAAMVGGTLPLDRFVGQLAAYLPVHRALESVLSASNDPAVRLVWRDELAKTPLLERDLAHFSSIGVEPSDAGTAAARRFVEWIGEVARNDPSALLGVLYVLEGSTLGAAVLRGHLERAYGERAFGSRSGSGAGTEVAPGLAYYSPYGLSPMPSWAQFKARMNAAIVDRAMQDRAVAAASETFRRIGEILAALSVGLPR
ncbi:MAG: biliverdin-producing heme oxygenase [Phycisphaerales bacterium]